MDKKRIIIIDGSSLLHRAFYALPLLSTKNGIYTNGIYGFLTMLYKVQEEKKPDYICVAFDKKGPTFRHEEYDKYKAHRQSTPSELVQQFPIIREILDAMKVRHLELTGFEADDIAGTLAKMGEESSLEVILVTGDKDYLQLATDNTKVLITRKGITELEEFDRNIIIEKYGITPEQLIDLKGLMGDQSDNIPGVPGIGEKTGLKLLKEYGTIENIYENIENISGKKLKENLIENKHLAFLSKKLGEIMTAVPMDISFEELKIAEPDWENLKRLYKELEFNSLLGKFSDDFTDNNEETSINLEYSMIGELDYNELIHTIKKEGKFGFKFIISNDNYIEDKIVALGIKTQGVPTKIVYLQEDKKNFIDSFKLIFEDKSIEKIGHNLKSDIVILSRLGIKIDNITFDSMIAQYLINPAQSSYTINEISKEYLNVYGMDEESLLGKGKSKRSFSDLCEEEIGNCLSFTLDTILNVESKMKEIIKEQEMLDLYYNVELPLVEVLGSMEYYGFKIDTDELKKLGKEYDEEINSLTTDIYTLADVEFNINSPKQLGEILFDKLSLPIVKKTKTGYSTDAEVLDKLKDQHPIVDKVLRYRQIVKLKSTYIDGLLNLINKDTNRVHSSFNQTITTTGRISSTEPNLQNIPIRTDDGRKIRKAFIAENNNYVLVDADYSQIELRVLAHISKDSKLMEAFINNEDIHRKTASEVFNVPKEEVSSIMRSRAKAVNFGIVYGISDYGLSRDLNISRKEAKEYIDNYLKNYKMVKEYMENIVEEGKEKGYVETILHRRRYIPELKAKNFNIKSFGERIAMNTPIQGSAADIIKMAMVKVYNELKIRNLKSRLILQIHDELIIEAEKDEIEEVKDIMKNIMENSIKLNVPLIVDLEVGDSWYDTK
ncbi:DNA polymerase I [uncultured Tissierella sp.]|uniref:DNA polymerase I n=1 Tax=uncultured Tissierella sp. TaxID=448160 RepID=UPI0028050F67|nr:DNA polymerase I [uncultured Tissierella sp.]MDU5082995.1 DNA polymerase I [Bacillota bacterium]